MTRFERQDLGNPTRDPGHPLDRGAILVLCVMLLTLAVFPACGKRGAASLADLEADFELESLHCGVTVEPRTRRMTNHLSMRLRARWDGARTFHLVPCVQPWQVDIQLVEIPSEPFRGALRRLSHMPELPFPIWRAELDRPASLHEQVEVRLGYSLTYDKAYPSSRLWEGIVPRGAYGIEWMPHLPGLLDEGRPTPQAVSATVELPVGWSLACPPDWARVRRHPTGTALFEVEEVSGPLLLAGPYTYRSAVVEGVSLHFYTFSNSSAAKFRLRAAEAIPVYLDLFGPPSHPESITMVEVPREHGGGNSWPGLVCVTEELTPGLSQAERLDTLIYHELGHQWPVASIENGPWIGADEAMTAYQEFLVLERIRGWETAHRHLLGKREQYLRAAETCDRLPSIEESGRLDFDHPARQPIQYDKGAWVWHSLRFLLGDESYFTFLHDLYTYHRYPSHDEFLNVLDRYDGELPTGRFVEQCLTGRGTAHFAVADLANRRTRSGFATTFTLKSVGDIHPPEVEVALSDGHGRLIVERVEMREGETLLELTTPFKVVGVEVDPNQWYLSQSGH